MKNSEDDNVDQICDNKFRKNNENVHKWNRAIPEEGYITLGTIRYGVRLSTGSSQQACSISSSRSSSSPNKRRIPSLSIVSKSSSSDSHLTVDNQVDHSLSSTTVDTCCSCIGTTGIKLPCWNSISSKNCCIKTTEKAPIKIQSAKNRILSCSQLSSLSSMPSTSQQINFPRFTTKIIRQNRSSTTKRRLSATLDPEIIELEPQNYSFKHKKFLNEPKSNNFEKMSNSSIVSSKDPSTTTSTTTPQQYSTKNSNMPIFSSSGSLLSTAIKFKEKENSYDHLNSVLYGNEEHDKINEYQQENEYQPFFQCISSSQNNVSELCQFFPTNTIHSPNLCDTHSDNHLNIYQQQNSQHKQIYVAIENSSSSSCSNENHPSDTDSVLIESLKPRELLLNKNITIPEYTTKNRKNSKFNFATNLKQSSLPSSSSPSIIQTKILCYALTNIKDNKNPKITNDRRDKSNIPRAILQQSLDNSENLTKSTFKKRSHRLSPPPPVPPKPYRNLPIVRSKSVDSQNENNYRTSHENAEDQDDLSYDPLNFRRKIQKFERQNFLQHQRNHQAPINPSIPNRFEFFNCFSKNNSSSSINIQTNQNENINEHQQLGLNVNVPICYKKNDSNNKLKQYHQNEYNKRENFRYNSFKRLKDNSSCDSTSNPSISSETRQLINNPTLNANESKKLLDFPPTKTISQSSSDSQLKQYFNDPQSATNTALTPAAVIRKLTPKLSKKSYNFSKNDNRLILHQDFNKTDLNGDNNNEFNLKNQCDCPTESDLRGVSYYDDDSDIGFIDSSGNNNDQLSSSLSSDLDRSLIGEIPLTVTNLKTEEPSDLISLKKVNLFNSDTRILNLSFDSVTKKFNHKNKLINEHFIVENIENNLRTDKDDFDDSLSDFDTSTISFLSEDNISCGCNLNRFDKYESVDIDDNIINSTSSFDSQKSTNQFEFLHNNCNQRGENNKLCCCNERVKRFCKELQNKDNKSNNIYVIDNYNSSENKHQNLYKSSDTEFPLSKSPTSPILSSSSSSTSSKTAPAPQTKVTTILRSSSTSETPGIIYRNSNNNNNKSVSGAGGCGGVGGGGVGVRGPLLKRVPAIESFGCISSIPNQQQHHQLNCLSQDKENIMEKRRNTLDRLQRLGFGRRSTSSPTQLTEKSKKSTEKSERLKELTELLRGNRSSPTPPPIPPPRKPRSHTNSFEKPEKPPDLTDSSSPISPLRAADSDEIIAMDEDVDDEQLNLPPSPPPPPQQAPHSYENVKTYHPVSPPVVLQKSSLYNTLRPNTSASNLEAFILRRNNREISKSPPPTCIKNQKDFCKQRPESRTIIGSFTSKENLYRSASFSQVDYSSGKYIKSTLCALRDKFRRDKSNRQQSVIDNANLTLPRKKDDIRGQSPRREQSAEPDFIYIPLKKTELNINLKYENLQCDDDKVPIEERFNPPDVIMEEDVSNIDGEKQNDITTIEEKEDILINFKNVENNDEEYNTLPTTIEENSIENENAFEPVPFQNSNLDTTCLATLTEEEIPMESPPENFLQTATTCLIPVPVFECVSREWDINRQSDKWIDMANGEIGLNQESVDPLALNPNELLNNFDKSSSNLQQIDVLPIISVSQETPHSSIDETPSPNKEINLSRLSVERSFDESRLINGKLIEFTEVKKRYSNDETKIGDRSQSADSILPRGVSDDEKRRIDKSRRRKGMYIQWPALERDANEIGINSDWNQSTESNSADEKVLTVDIQKTDYSDIKSDTSSCQTPGSFFMNCPTSDRTPGSISSFEPFTPDSDYNGRPPIWPRVANRRTSLSCQSSEEKDEVPSNNNNSSNRSQRNLHYFKNDSISDNESDRTPPPSRERTSPSPAPGEQDFKRYSKRPLRGPYGQMLEAEMKKPGKLQYDEILEELKDTDGFSKFTGRTHNVHSNRSFENTRTIPQYSSSMRIRKSNAYLPVPTHTRAASTPSQMENVCTNASTTIDGINPQEKRYQSNLLDSTTSSESYSIGGPLSGTVRTSTGQHIKKNSLDNCKRDRSPKRASSEIPENKIHPKRSSSTASERHHHENNKDKRNLEDSRLSQSSRTAFERNMALESSKCTANQSGNLIPTPELLAALLKGSSERQISTERQQLFADTRSHVVHEMFQHEQNYVVALNTVVEKYYHVLKTPEYAGMIDSRTVDEIFYMIPEILGIHEKFLNELQSRLDTWDSQQKVGDAFLETFSKPEVLETYTCYVNNCNRAEDAIRITKQSRPSFAKFLQTTASKHAGKLSLANFLIKPVQKFPHYEMLFKRLIKNTDADHPDQKPLEEVLKLAKDISVHLDCKKKEVNENGQREATLRELENVIDGITELLAPERQFLGFEMVSVVSSGQGARKERGFFLFSDLLVLTSIKRIKKPNTIIYPGSVASTLDTNTNKYKFLIKVSLDNIEIIKTKDENLRKKMNEIEDLISDSMKWQQICELIGSLKSPHQWFEEKARDYLCEVQRTLVERQSNDTQLNLLELLINSPSGSQNLSIAFGKAEKRAQWEETVNEAKQKLAASLERHPIPEFKISIAICKTRAGLQFTCAAPILSDQKDVWVCNSDGYIGQVGILSINPEPPTVKICAGICNARILCVASVPAASEAEIKSREPSVEEIPPSSRNSSNSSNYTFKTTEKNDDDNEIAKPATKSSIKSENYRSDMQLDSNSSSDDSEPEGGSSSINSESVASGGTSTLTNVSQSVERVPSPAPTTASPNSSSLSTTIVNTVFHQQQDSNSDETDCQQSTMWLGTEDGCIHVYNCNDNIRTKKNKLKIEHKSSVYSILYLDNRVFVSLANGDICVYMRDSAGWNTQSPLCISIGTVSSPVNKLLNVHGKLWCSIQGIIKVIDTKTLQVENQIQISSDSKPITNMVVCNNYVWISIQNSAHIKCFHSNSHELIFEINLAPSVNKMLSNCDDIIRQHKAACLRVTSLLACKDLIWIGTSAGVLLTIPAQGYSKDQTIHAPIVTGIPHGHTGHVRFLTCIDSSLGGASNSALTTSTATSKSIATTSGNNFDKKSNRHSMHSKSKSETGNILIISGGDGYENFGNSGSLSEVAGREDSTNHLLLWQI